MIVSIFAKSSVVIYVCGIVTTFSNCGNSFSLSNFVSIIYCVLSGALALKSSLGFILNIGIYIYLNFSIFYYFDNFLQMMKFVLFFFEIFKLGGILNFCTNAIFFFWSSQYFTIIFINLKSKFIFHWCVISMWCVSS